MDEWLSRSAFQRLDLKTQAGQFGNAGRNIARGPSYTSIDLSFARTFAIGTQTRLQFRAEAFNAFNNVNYTKVSLDAASPNSFGVFTESAPARVMQFALRYEF